METITQILYINIDFFNHWPVEAGMQNEAWNLDTGNLEESKRFLYRLTFYRGRIMLTLYSFSHNFARNAMV